MTNSREIQEKPLRLKFSIKYGYWQAGAWGSLYQMCYFVLRSYTQVFFHLTCHQKKKMLSNSSFSFSGSGKCQHEHIDFISSFTSLLLVPRGKKGTLCSASLGKFSKSRCSECGNTLKYPSIIEVVCTIAVQWVCLRKMNHALAF